MAFKLLRGSRTDSKGTWHIKGDTEQLQKIIEVQEELIKNLQKQVMAQGHYIHALFKNLEEAKAESKERHAKGREKTKKPKK